MPEDKELKIEDIEAMAKEALQESLERQSVLQYCYKLANEKSSEERITQISTELYASIVGPYFREKKIPLYEGLIAIEAMLASLCHTALENAKAAQARKALVDASCPTTVN